MEAYLPPSPLAKAWPLGLPLFLGDGGSLPCASRLAASPRLDELAPSGSRAPTDQRNRLGEKARSRDRCVTCAHGMALSRRASCEGRDLVSLPRGAGSGSVDRGGLLAGRLRPR